MKPRIDLNAVSPSALRAMMALQAYVNGSGLEPSLLELVKMRASQINGRSVREHFSEDELVSLTLALVAINGWNRINVAFRNVPGSYRASPGRNSFAH